MVQLTCSYEIVKDKRDTDRLRGGRRYRFEML